MKQKKRFKEFQTLINKNKMMKSRSLERLPNSSANSNINTTIRCNRTYDAIYQQRSISIDKEDDLHSSYGRKRNNNPHISVSQGRPKVQNISRSSCGQNRNSTKSNKTQKNVSIIDGQKGQIRSNSYCSQSSNSIKTNNPQRSVSVSRVVKVSSGNPHGSSKSSLTKIKGMSSNDSRNNDQIIESIIDIANIIQSTTKDSNSSSSKMYCQKVPNLHQIGNYCQESNVEHTKGDNNSNLYERKENSCQNQDNHCHYDFSNNFAKIRSNEKGNKSKKSGSYCQQYTMDDFPSNESDDCNVPNIMDRPRAYNRGKVEQNQGNHCHKDNKDKDNLEENKNDEDDSTSDVDMDNGMDNDMDNDIVSNIINGAIIINDGNEIMTCTDRNWNIVGPSISDSSASFQSNNGSYSSIDRNNGSYSSIDRNGDMIRKLRKETINERM